MDCTSLFMKSEDALFKIYELEIHIQLTSTLGLYSMITDLKTSIDYLGDDIVTLN